MPCMEKRMGLGALSRTGGWMRVCSLVFAKDAAKADCGKGKGIETIVLCGSEDTFRIGTWMWWFNFSSSYI
ncbi:hypothetical protein CK203_105050 [Vitis vinifera]|uniref:Uncharacterized protein n=1 Tax=Vitis vinifera TaxID=29760 RepID=A0A438D298_VITVI|nr:hypothetical protein CK203_105050 [Vitis vinifera]